MYKVGVRLRVGSV